MSRSHDSKAGSGTDRERGLAENTMTRSPMKIFFFLFFLVGSGKEVKILLYSMFLLKWGT